jgi:hypothetical protein
MKNELKSLKNFTAIVGLLVTFTGGIAWLTTLHDKVTYLEASETERKEKIKSLESHEMSNKERLSRIEAKIDMIIKKLFN